MAETVEQLQTEIAERYTALSEDDMITLRGLIGTEELRVLGRVLGPQIANIIDVGNIKPAPRTKKRGLGTR
jgi:hypothetical protein|tara:strand:+ start:2442 stop:2654 length:213 start_codon:yes stop_codon:yes gene_type:complete